MWAEDKGWLRLGGMRFTHLIFPYKLNGIHGTLRRRVPGFWNAKSLRDRPRRGRRRGVA